MESPSDLVYRVTVLQFKSVVSTKSSLNCFPNNHIFKLLKNMPCTLSLALFPASRQSVMFIHNVYICIQQMVRIQTPSCQVLQFTVWLHLLQLLVLLWNPTSEAPWSSALAAIIVGYGPPCLSLQLASVQPCDKLPHTTRFQHDRTMSLCSSSFNKQLPHAH